MPGAQGGLLWPGHSPVGDPALPSASWLRWKGHSDHGPAPESLHHLHHSHQVPARARWALDSQKKTPGAKAPGVRVELDSYGTGVKSSGASNSSFEWHLLHSERWPPSYGFGIL